MTNSIEHQDVMMSDDYVFDFYLLSFQEAPACTLSGEVLMKLDKLPVVVRALEVALGQDLVVKVRKLQMEVW